MVKNDEIQKIEYEMIIEIERISKMKNLQYFLAYGSVLGAIRHKGFIPWDSDIDIMVFIDDYDHFCDSIRAELFEKFSIKYYKYDKNYDSLKARISLRNQEHSKIHIDIFPIVGSPKTMFGKLIFSKLAFLSYKGYFIKKVDVDLVYNIKKKQRRIVKVLKLFFCMIPDKAYQSVFNILCSLNKIDNSEEVLNICGSYGLREFIPKSWLNEIKYADFINIKLPLPIEWDAYLKHMYGDYMIPKEKDFLS